MKITKMEIIFLIMALFPTKAFSYMSSSNDTNGQIWEGNISTGFGYEYNSMGTPVANVYATESDDSSNRAGTVVKGPLSGVICSNYDLNSGRCIDGSPLESVIEPPLTSGAINQNVIDRYNRRMQ